MWFLPYEKKILRAIWITLLSGPFNETAEAYVYFDEQTYPLLKSLFRQTRRSMKLMLHILLMYLWWQGLFKGGLFWSQKPVAEARLIHQRFMTSPWYLVRAPYFLLRLTLIHVTYGAQEPVYQQPV